VLRPARWSGELPRATATARITPFAPMPVPRGEADFRQLDLALVLAAATAHAPVRARRGCCRRTSRLRLAARGAQRRGGPWDAGRLPVASARVQGEWRDGVALVKALSARGGGRTVEGSGAWEGQGWRFEGRVDQVDPARLHTALAPLPLSGPLKLEGEGRSVAFDLSLQAGAPRAAAVAGNGLASAAAAMALRELLAQGRWSGDTLSLGKCGCAPATPCWKASSNGSRGRTPAAASCSCGRLACRPRPRGSIAPARGQGSADLAASDLAQAQHWIARWPGLQKVFRCARIARTRRRRSWRGRADGRILRWTPTRTRA
jgi:translocation and assembly module TamB